ncbi:MAG: hypothetical protein N2747_10160 [Chitinophagaceae bacterium]|nr:hypothetical protein [Chitinophagaceae bacterium]
MNIFKGFFDSSSKNGHLSAETFAPQATSVVESLPENTPPIDLFIDREPPQGEQEETVSQSKSKISAFLERDFHSIGVKDGFEYHSFETLETGKKKIRAEFQLIIDQMIQEKLEKRLQLKMMVVNVEKISDETRRNLEFTIDELNSSIELLKKQKELSTENEGWVMNAIHSYHQGFVQGLNDFIESENLLNSIKNL